MSKDLKVIKDSCKNDDNIVTKLGLVVENVLEDSCSVRLPVICIPKTERVAIQV